MAEHLMKERAERVENAFRLLQENKDNLGNIPGILRQLVSLKVWEGYNWKGKVISFGTFREFVEASPPEGLGTTIDELIALSKKYPEVVDLIDLTVQNQTSEYHRPKNTLSSKKIKSGNSYQRNFRQLRILAAEDPKAKVLHEKVLKGELSVGQALIQLGKRRRRYGVENTPDSVVKFVRRHFSSSQIKKIHDELAK